MVARILGLAEAPKPADAADALAIAICHAWRGAPATDGGAAGAAQTPAQAAWLAAERSARTSAVPRRLAR
jgi:crossover junction endodeoxyribonuclease RuvC